MNAITIKHMFAAVKIISVFLVRSCAKWMFKPK